MINKTKGKTCEESMCEKSMKIVTNIIKLSSLSIAQMTLGVTSVKTPKGYAPITGSNVVPDDNLLFQFQGSKKSQERKSSPSPMYVTKPVDDSHVFLKKRFDVEQTKEEGVDRLADQYIKKVRQQLGLAVNKKSTLSSNALASPQLAK